MNARRVGFMKEGSSQGSLCFALLRVFISESTRQLSSLLRVRSLSRSRWQEGGFSWVLGTRAEKRTRRRTSIALILPLLPLLEQSMLEQAVILEYSGINIDLNAIEISSYVYLSTR